MKLWHTHFLLYFPLMLYLTTKGICSEPNPRNSHKYFKGNLFTIFGNYPEFVCLLDINWGIGTYNTITMVSIRHYCDIYIIECRRVYICSIFSLFNRYKFKWNYVPLYLWLITHLGMLELHPWIFILQTLLIISPQSILMHIITVVLYHHWKYRQMSSMFMPYVLPQMPTYCRQSIFDEDWYKQFEYIVNTVI